MQDFENVPVPKELVVEVMRFIAARVESPVAAPAHLPRPEIDTQPTTAPGSWTRSELEVIAAHRQSMPAVELFGQVLTHLAGISPSPHQRDDIAAALGEEDGLRMVKKFGAVTRFINKRIPSQRNSWPISFEERGWFLDADTAKLWTAIVSVD